MWKVTFEDSSAARDVERQIKSGLLTNDDRQVIAAWVRQVQLMGPESVRGNKRWSDHELSGSWKGYRSSCFSNSGRILYRIKGEVVTVLIARITTDHDYRPRRKK